MTRPFTPRRRNPDGSTTITVQRSCNGCGHPVGDVSDVELSAARSGLPLPDVRDECPYCGHKELVGPVPSVTFSGGPYLGLNAWGARPKVAYVPPRDTCDPRARACTEHHVACDCREAEFAEYAAENRYERKATQAAFDTILDGHATYSHFAQRVTAWGDEAVYEPAPQALCMCTGCQIARAAHIYPRGSS